MNHDRESEPPLTLSGCVKWLYLTKGRFLDKPPSSNCLLLFFFFIILIFTFLRRKTKRVGKRQFYRFGRLSKEKKNVGEKIWFWERLVFERREVQLSEFVFCCLHLDDHNCFCSWRTTLVWQKEKHIIT